jgi:hypothetical protein
VLPLVKSNAKPNTGHVFELETLGLTPIVIGIVGITVTGSRHHINWSAR